MNRYRRMFFAVGCSLTLFVLSGCSGFSPNGSNALQGFVFSKVRVPYTTDLNMTPTTQNGFGDQTITVQEPFSGYGISAGVNSNAIGEIAQKHKLAEVYFADIETLSVLGVWTTETIYVYGKQNIQTAQKDTL